MAKKTHRGSGPARPQAPRGRRDNEASGQRRDPRANDAFGKGRDRDPRANHTSGKRNAARDNDKAGKRQAPRENTAADKRRDPRENTPFVKHREARAHTPPAKHQEPREARESHAPSKQRDTEALPKRREARPGRGHDGQQRAVAGEVWIHGLHAVTAALRNPARKILRIAGTAEALAILRNDPEIDVPGLAHAQTSGRSEIDSLVGPNAVHQGIAVLARTLEPDLGEVLEALGDRKSVCLMILDQVTDPHNVGAVMRSAAAFGAAAVIAPERGAPEETGTMAKAASGALDVTPYIKGGNLVRVLEQLKEHGFWMVGLAADAPQELSAVDLTGRIALLVGAEGEGLRRLVRETCDHLAHLPMRGPMESLNVSNAAAVALYEWTRQTPANT